jgi:glycosyltransferase involved in cell wall biosynthesis
MRIALLHYTQSPIIGGVERIIRDQAAALCILGHEVATLTRESAGDLSRFDAVIVHNVFTMPFDLAWTRELTALAAASPQQRWINWVHDVAAVNPYYAHMTWQEPVPKALHVAVSEVRRQDYARANGLPQEAIQVIPNGLDFASVLDLTPRIAALKLWRHDLVLLHPTRLIRRKNIELGLLTTAVLKQTGVKVLYAVTGAPDPHQADGKTYHQELRKLTEELKIEAQVSFLGESGPLSQEDVRSLYVSADALFFPSTGEGFGLPLLEAQAHRLPIFCSDLQVHVDVLGLGGRYFSTDDKPEVISAQIMQWTQTDLNIHHRRHLWRDHEMVRICQEHLEPLLLTATAITTP